MPLLLTRKDVQAVLTMGEAIAAVEEGYRSLARGQVTMPQRSAIRLPEHKGLHLTMPAGVAAGSGALAVKVVTVYPENPARFGLPTTIGTLLLNDPRTGELLAIMEAGYLTAVRTGAASGLATRVLSRPESSTVGIFGAGVQARTQLEGVCEVRKIARVLVCDVVKEARDRFASEMGDRLGIPIETTEDPRDCLAQDIVITATSSQTPLFAGKDLRPGTHINCIGSHSPQARELDSETVRRARVISDLADARLAEDADFMVPLREGLIAEEHVRTEIGQVLIGQAAGRTSPEEITLFKSGGLAVQDAVTGARVLELARAKGVGREVEL